MHIGWLAPAVQVPEATFLLLVERFTDLPTTRTHRKRMFVMTENMQYILPFLSFNRINPEIYIRELGQLGEQFILLKSLHGEN